MTVDFNKALGKEFYLRPTPIVAKELIGKLFVRKIDGIYVAAKIVETEAYLSENDLASHSAPGLTKRNKPMFEEGGIIYVYKIYGVHHCVNVVTEQSGIGCAVLIRSAQPILGINLIQKFRQKNTTNDLLRGPGNFARGFNFTLKDNFASLLSPELFIQEFESYDDGQIGVSQRIGIVKSKELMLRFYLRNSPFVSARPKD